MRVCFTGRDGAPGYTGAVKSSAKVRETGIPAK